MKLSFTKMQGLGNDFVVIDAFTRKIDLGPDRYRFFANRHFGIGCDQILVVEKSDREGVDFKYRIFNADGGEVEQCGNGARCFVRFVHDKHLTEKREIRVETLSGVIALKLEEDGGVTVNMGPPEFEPERIPFIAQERSLTYLLDVGGKEIEISALSMGNPHAVRLVSDIETAKVAQYGALIESHPRFPKRVNAGFLQIVDRKHVRLRVYERGAGETLACGTGACAAVVAGITRGLLDSGVKVSTRGGELFVRWEGEGHPVWMTGPAVSVFEGEIEIPGSGNEI